MALWPRSPPSDAHAYRYYQSQSRCIACQDDYVQQSHAAKRLQLSEVNLCRFAGMLFLRSKDQR